VAKAHSHTGPEIKKLSASATLFLCNCLFFPFSLSIQLYYRLTTHNCRHPHFTSKMRPCRANSVNYFKKITTKLTKNAEIKTLSFLRRQESRFLRPFPASPFFRFPVSGRGRWAAGVHLANLAATAPLEATSGLPTPRLPDPLKRPRKALSPRSLPEILGWHSQGLPEAH